MDEEIFAAGATAWKQTVGEGTMSMYRQGGSGKSTF
jgi:hypothetical protein